MPRSRSSGRSAAARVATATSSAGCAPVTGVTGAPILLDALTYVEARITGSLDNEENTVFVGDVVAAERLNPGGRLDIGEAWARLGTEWTEEYERNHEDQVDHCRPMRGLPIPERA